MMLALLGCAARPALQEEALRERHARVYEVYTLGADRDAVHDWLAESFAGEALTREYLEHYTTLVRLEQAGMWVEPMGVQYDDVLVVGEGEAGVVLEVAWMAAGRVHHPNHTHDRLNHYRALYTLADTPAGPRIVETRLQSARRLLEPPPPEPAP